MMVGLLKDCLSKLKKDERKFLNPVLDEYESYFWYSDNTQLRFKKIDKNLLNQKSFEDIHDWNGSTWVHYYIIFKDGNYVQLPFKWYWTNGHKTNEDGEDITIEEFIKSNSIPLDSIKYIVELNYDSWGAWSWGGVKKKDICFEIIIYKS